MNCICEAGASYASLLPWRSVQNSSPLAWDMQTEIGIAVTMMRWLWLHYS